MSAICAFPSGTAGCPSDGPGVSRRSRGEAYRTDLACARMTERPAASRRRNGTRSCAGTASDRRALQHDLALVERQAVEARPVLRREGLEPVERAFLLEHRRIGFERERRVEDAGAAAGRLLRARPRAGRCRCRGRIWASPRSRRGAPPAGAARASPPAGNKRAGRRPPSNSALRLMIRCCGVTVAAMFGPAPRRRPPPRRW